MQKIKQALKVVFGSFNYQKPSWLLNLQNKLASSVAAYPQRYKKSAYVVGGIVVLGAVGFLGKYYYDSRPQPEKVTFKVNPIYGFDFERPDNARSLYINFSKSVANVNMIGKLLGDDVRMKPELKGEWVWSSDRELKFTPYTEKGKIDWPLNQEFEGSFKKSIFAPNTLLETNEFEFKTANITASLESSEFYQDPRYADTKKVTATFRFNYPVDTESIKKRIELHEKIGDGFEGKSKKEFNISFDEKKSRLFLTSSNISVDNDNKKFTYILSKGFSSVFGGSADEGNSAVVFAPSLYDYFKINSSSVVIVRNEKFESEQILRIENVAEIASEELGKVLQVYELPYNSLEASEEEKKLKRPYAWNSPSEVSPEVLKKSKKVNFTVIPTEESVSLAHSFRFSGTPGRSLYLKIPKDTTSFGGFKLKYDYENILLVPQYPSDLQIMGKGSLIPLSGSKHLSLVSRNLNKISYELNQIRMEQVNHLIPALIYDYSRPDIYEVRPDRIAERITGEIPLVNKNPQKNQFSAIDLSTYIGSGKKGLFLVSVRSKDSPENVSDNRFVILTDIGMIVKKSISGSYDVYVQNIGTGMPVVGAKVSVMGQNGINILSGDTNALGAASFPNLKDFKHDKMPIAFVAQYGDSLSFVPYNSYSRELDMTQFETGGIHDASESDDLNAFIFSDRGIYRPGEKADFGLVVRSKSWGKSFAQIPIDVIVRNASGQEAFKQTIKVSSNSMESVTFETEEFFQTGQYTIYAYMKDKNKNSMMIGSTTFQVEEFVPDQIKVRTSLSISEIDGWVKPTNLKLNLTAFNLYGKPATNRIAKSNLRIRAADIYFKKWKDYYFNTPKSNQLESNESLPHQTTNDNGEAEWDLNLDSLEKSIYRMYVDTEVFETGGGKSVKAQLSQLISHQDYFLGFKADSSLSTFDFSFIKKSENATLNLITINSKLDTIAVKDLQVVLIERRPTSVLTKLPNETYAYQTVYKENVLKTTKISTQNKPTSFKLDTGVVGEFILVFKDTDNTELNRLVYNVVGDADPERGLDKSSILKLGLNKKDFKPGEEIEVQIKAPYAGAGLMTIERDKVYVSKWFKTTGRSAVEKIQIPSGLEGQAYIVVTMLRDPKSEEIYTSPLSYGVAPFAIDLEARRSKLEISAPELVKPGQNLAFKVKSDQRTKAAIYLVDEGILQVANYKLPQPLNFFFQKKALQVSTAQILDLVLPDFNLLGQAAAGGDGAAMLGFSINPFKRKTLPPVAHWVGIKDIGPDWTTIQYSVPDHFNGNLKVMVVTADEKKLGSASVDVNVRGDFIINATATTFTSPQDEFEVNLIVANQLKGSGENAAVEIEVQSSEGYSLVDKKIDPVTIPENKEKSFNFKVKATDKLGAHSLTIAAGIGNKKTKLEITISNRPAVPHQQNLQWMILKDKLELKPMTPMKSEYHKNYLQAYTNVQDLIKPFESFYEVSDYLCTEQIASQLLPLVLKNEKNKEEISKANRLITLLRVRQQAEGSFTLYPGQNDINYDASLHLGMVFLYMQEKGEPIPADMWQRYIQSLKSDYNYTKSSTDLYRKAKSIYILLRSQFVPKADLKNMATLMADKSAQQSISSTAALYLSASFKLAGQDDLSDKSLKLAEKNQQLKIGDDYLFEDADEFEKAAVLMRHFEKAADVVSSKTFSRLLEAVNQRQLNTYSAGYLLMALDSMLKQGATAGLDKISVKAVKADKSENGLQISKQRRWDFDESIVGVNLANSSSTPFLLSYLQSGFSAVNTMQEKISGIEISRNLVDDNGVNVSQVEIGQEVTVKIRARNQLKKHSSILISDLLPAGFEVVMSSVRTQQVDNEQEPSEEQYYEGDEEGEGEGESEVDASIWNLLMNKAYAAGTDASVPAMMTDLVDVREDRVNIYSSLNENMNEFTYKIKAISKGKFIVPGIYAKGLYRTDLTGQGASGMIEVK